MITLSPMPAEPDWNAVKTAFLQGGSAAAIAREFGLSANRVQRRARLEGWRAERSTPSQAKRAAATPEAAAEAALADASLALSDGRLDEADSLVRLAERLTKAAASLASLTQKPCPKCEENDDPRTLDDIRADLEARILRIAEAEGLTGE